MRQVALATAALRVPSLLLAALIALASAAQAAVTWPHVLRSDGEEVQVHQPQVDSWGDGRLDARSVVVITRPGQAAPLHGVMWFSARTMVDEDQRTVTLYDLEVSRTSFPDQPPDSAASVTRAAALLDSWSFTTALDPLLVDIAVTGDGPPLPNDQLGTDVPAIHVRRVPAVLVLVDGEPVLREVAGTSLLEVLNTPAVMAFQRDPATWYLRGDGYWMAAGDIAGPWRRASSTPGDLDELVPADEEPTAAGVGDARPPEVIVSTVPAELVTIDGDPQYSAIRGTRLLYVTNTDSDLFQDTAGRAWHVLLSGRWFTARSLDGPWQLVPPADVPADFGRIPADHPKAGVRASVPGTEEANEALAAARVPQTARVDRATTQFSAIYDGEPRFERIEGTRMSYAVNAEADILRIEDRYYAVSDGVWFVADGPHGPWAVCDRVPEEVYSMPASSPLYHLKFVYVYDSTPEYVNVGYLPGYHGVYAWDGVVVYGTGYHYPSWAWDWWYGWPWTWGLGFQWGYWDGGFFCRHHHHGHHDWHHWHHDDHHGGGHGGGHDGGHGGGHGGGGPDGGDHAGGGRPDGPGRDGRGADHHGGGRSGIDDRVGDGHRGVHGGDRPARPLYNRDVLRSPDGTQVRRASAYDRWQGAGVTTRHPAPPRATGPSDVVRSGAPRGVGNVRVGPGAVSSPRPGGTARVPPHATPTGSSAPRPVPSRASVPRRNFYADGDGSVYRPSGSGWQRRDGKGWDTLKPAAQPPSAAAPRPGTMTAPPAAGRRQAPPVVRPPTPSTAPPLGTRPPTTASPGSTRILTPPSYSRPTPALMQRLNLERAARMQGAARVEQSRGVRPQAPPMRSPVPSTRTPARVAPPSRAPSSVAPAPRPSSAPRSSPPSRPPSHSSGHGRGRG